jgi:hypothetical protein
MTKVLGVAVVAALVLAGLGVEAVQGETRDTLLTMDSTVRLGANLKAGTEVPKPSGVPANATGRFRGKSTFRSFTWQLTFFHLSGKAVAAHIHLGKPGKAGGVVLALCGPCTNGQKGAALLTKGQETKILERATYVNIHTPKNAAGEIRGQVATCRYDGLGHCVFRINP